MGNCLCNIFGCKKRKETPPDSTPLLLPLPIYDYKSRHNIEEFEIGEQIGQGASSTVHLVTLKKDKKEYALKVIKKSRKFQDESFKQNIKNEKKLISILDNPFVSKLKYAFQDNKNLYLLMDYCKGGDLGLYLEKKTIISGKKAKQCLAEVILALEYLHSKNIIYCDLKPQNIVINEQGHIKIIDFGVSKLLDEGEDFPTEFEGTKYYAAPEVWIKDKQYDYRADWWSLGCFFYEIIVGKVPFNTEELNGREDYENFFSKEIEKIKEKKNGKTDEEFIIYDLILKLLVINPDERLGNKSADEIKNHEYFQGFNWKEPLKMEILQRQNTSLYLPNNRIEKKFTANYLKNSKDDPEDGKGYCLSDFSFDEDTDNIRENETNNND